MKSLPDAVQADVDAGLKTHYVVDLVPGAPSSFEWKCAACGRLTHDSYVPAVGFMTDTCATCRGYNTATPEQCQSEIDARQAALDESVRRWKATR